MSQCRFPCSGIDLAQNGRSFLKIRVRLPVDHDQIIDRLYFYAYELFWPGRIRKSARRARDMYNAVA